MLRTAASPIGVRSLTAWRGTPVPAAAWNSTMHQRSALSAAGIGRGRPSADYLDNQSPIRSARASQTLGGDTSKPIMTGSPNCPNSGQRKLRRPHEWLIQRHGRHAPKERCVVSPIARCGVESLKLFSGADAQQGSPLLQPSQGSLPRKRDAPCE